ncbi:MAG: phosphatidylserine/phosphatidylglycerophosphate/cardiolipin synthase family protein [Patescibacteria group bacterium]
MKYRLYTTSQKAWDGMFQAMLLAQKSIYIEMYIFLNDTKETHNFLSLLKTKAENGLEVIVIADSFGSSALRSTEVNELRRAGVEFLYFSHWFRRTHRKIVIIDNKIALIGGVNIYEKIRYWRDMQIKLQGMIVKPILKSFAYSYELAGGKREAILIHSRLPLVRKIKSWVIDNLITTSKIHQLSSYYRQRIISARDSIIIVTPYLLPPRWLMALLDNACHREVRVEIMIPNDTDIDFLNRVNYLNACRLAEKGVKIYLTPIMNHAKIMLIDKREALIGSQNMDVLSFNWNIEAGVFFEQKQLVADLDKVISEWKKGAIEFSVSHRKTKFFDRCLIFLLKIFYKIF